MAIDTRQTAASNTAAESSAKLDARDTFEVINPADDSVIADVPIDGPAEVAATVARVRANQPAWEELGIKGRAEWLYKHRDWLLERPRTSSTSSTSTARRPTSTSATRRWRPTRP